MKNLQNLRRRSLSLLLALVMCISVMQIPAFAADGGETASSSSSDSSTPSDNSSSNDTSSSDASGGGESSTSSTDTGSTTTTSADTSDSGDSTGTDASDNGGSDNSGAPESKTETAGNNEPASNNTETNEPADSSEDQDNSAPAQETDFVTVAPETLVTDNQEKNENDNNDNDAWNQVVANVNLSANKRPMMMAAAPAQQNAASREDTKTETVTENLPLPENGVAVTVEPNETEKVDIPSDVTIPNNATHNDDGTITWTTTTKPDNVPENATQNADGSWTWTEKKDQDPGLTGFTPVGDPSVIMESTEDGKLRETITQKYKNENGDTYTKVTEIIKEPGQNTAGQEPDETDTAITVTTTTTEKTETTTVKPGTVEVTMDPVERPENSPINQEDFDVTGATVTIKNGSDGKYNADVKIGLSGKLQGDGSVTVTVKVDGKEYTTTLDKVDESGNYTLSGITLEGLDEGAKQNISVTITGQQIKEIVTPGNGSTAPDNMTPETQPGKVVTIGYDSKNGIVTAVEGTDSNKIKEVHEFLGTLEVTNDFAIYADEYGQSIDHIDGNICVNKLTNSHQEKENGTNIRIPDLSQCGPKGATNEERQELLNDYVYNGFSYVGTSTATGVSVTSNTVKQENGKFSDGATLVTGENVTVLDSTNNKFDVVKLESTMFGEDGKLTAEAKAELTEGHPELAHLDEAIDIVNNLNEIAKEGQDLIGDAGNGGVAGDEAKLAATIKYLSETKDLTSSDVISLTVSIDTLTTSNGDYGTQYFSKLIDANKSGATIIINVDMEDEEKTSDVTLLPYFANGVDNYDGNAANLVWNFGDHEGTITFANQTVGRIVAPKALLKLNGGIQAGNAVGRIVSHGYDNGNNYQGEIHMAVPSDKDKHDWPKPDKPQTETVTTNLTVRLTVKVDGGEKIITTEGGSNTVKIESVTTNTYEKPEVPTPPDDKPGGDIPGPGPGPGSKPDPKPEPQPEPEPPVVDVPDEDVPLIPTPEPEPTLPDKPDDANTPNVPDIDIPDDDVPLSANPNVPTLDIPDGNVPLASVPGTDDGLVEIEEEEVPLAEVPQTGDTFASWALLAALSLCGVTALALPGKRKER